MCICIQYVCNQSLLVCKIRLSRCFLFCVQGCIYQRCTVGGMQPDKHACTLGRNATTLEIFWHEHLTWNQRASVLQSLLLRLISPARSLVPPDCAFMWNEVVTRFQSSCYYFFTVFLPPDSASVGRLTGGQTFNQVQLIIIQEPGGRGGKSDARLSSVLLCSFSFACVIFYTFYHQPSWLSFERANKGGEM